MNQREYNFFVAGIWAGSALSAFALIIGFAMGAAS